MRVLTITMITLTKNTRPHSRTSSIPAYPHFIRIINSSQRTEHIIYSFFQVSWKPSLSDFYPNWFVSNPTKSLITPKPQIWANFPAPTQKNQDAKDDDTAAPWFSQVSVTRNLFSLTTYSGWWFGHPSEKYESQLGWLATQYFWENKIHVPNHQPVFI